MDQAGRYLVWAAISARARQEGMPVSLRHAVIACADSLASAVHALPMRLREETLGAMNLFSDVPGPLDEDTIALGQALADAATIGILHQRAVARHELIAEQLQSALNSRIVIEQAKGFLAERLTVNVDLAFALLRGYARDHNRKLTDVATDVVRGRLQVRRPGSR